MFKLIVDKNIADTAVTERLTSGSVGLELDMEFSADWNGLIKRAVFFNGEQDVEVVIDKNTCKIPPESLAKSGLNLTVGIRGESLDGQIVIPTVYANLGQIEEGARTGGNNSQPVTPNLVNQIQDIAQSAKDTAQSVRDDANAGKFDGAPGKAPKIGDNTNWFVWDDALSDWVDTGVYSGGQAPFIGTNGNWFVGDTDTGVKAQGEQGAPGKDSDVTKAYVDSLPLTIKSDAIPEITDEETLREYFYQLRKSPKRKWQFEVSSGKNENIVTGLGGRPNGVSADESAFIYIELPYSEAGGFVIKATYLLRNKADAYEKLLHATYSTPTPTWHDSGWYNPAKGDVTAEELKRPVHTTMYIDIVGDGFGSNYAYYNGEKISANSILNHVNADGVVIARYDVPGTSETRCYYYSQKDSTRQPVFLRSYIEGGVSKQAVITVDNNSKVTVTYRSGFNGLKWNT